MFPFCFSIAWNPVNFVDGEAHWIASELAFIILGIVGSKALQVLLRYVQKRMKSSTFDLVADAMTLPIISLIWYFVGLYTIDLVTEEFLSQARPTLWSVLRNGSIVLGIGWFLFRLKNRLLERAIEKKTLEGRIPDANSMQAISKLFTVVISLVILLLLNDFTGIGLTTLLAFGGVGGLALAFASQEIVSNFFGGFMVHMTRPFLIGEIVSMPSLSIEGTVEEIGWYQTRIRPPTKAAVYIPNSLFTKALLINKTRITHRLFEETIYVTLPSLQILSAIVIDIDAYLASHPLFDRAETTGARIESIGETPSIVITGLTRSPTLRDFHRLKGEVFLHIVSIIQKHGGKVVDSPTVVSIPTNK